MTRPAHAVRCRQCKNDFRKILEVESHARLHPNGISLDKEWVYLISIAIDPDIITAACIDAPTMAAITVRSRRPT